MNKRFTILFILVVFMLTIFAGCGNRALLDPGTFTFKHVHISDQISGHCYEIDKWWDNESGIEVRTSNGNGIYLSEGTYQLFESKSVCPYCN